MTLALLLGAGVGLGLCLLVAGLRPAPLSLPAALHRLDQPPAAPRTATAHPDTTGLVPGLRWWLGHRTAAAGRGDGLLAGLSGDATADLAVTGTPAELHAGAKALSGLTGLLSPALLTALLRLAGLGLPLLLPLWLALTGALIGYLLPDLRLRRQAGEARRAFRTSVGAYLDLVAMRMASGSGLAEALGDAAAIGTGPAFARIRGALADARTDGLTPAQALGRLGQQLHLPDLIDVSTRLRLVDTSGAQAQTSLRAQAASLRDRELADAQGRANEQSQSMLVAQVVLGFGFVLFLGYPAVARVLAT
jgi:tight adherence protein C